MAPVAATPSPPDFPPNSFVMVAFNRADKVSPETWAAWEEILDRAPNAVLWVLTPSSHMQLPSHPRLFVAPKVPKPEHLARHRHGHLFLDVFHYGAHTTATDALLTGLPVLTTPGRTFASRVCAGVLVAAGMGELVAGTRRQFIGTHFFF
jgi:predicted O-linked N-acetylglucosamine transferase (SPINDLY family)